MGAAPGKLSQRGTYRLRAGRAIAFGHKQFTAAAPWHRWPFGWMHSVPLRQSLSRSARVRAERHGFGMEKMKSRHTRPAIVRNAFATGRLTPVRPHPAAPTATEPGVGADGALLTRTERKCSSRSSLWQRFGGWSQRESACPVWYVRDLGVGATGKVPVLSRSPSRGKCLSCLVVW